MLLTPLVQCISYVFPQVSNNFAFVVLKPRLPDDLHPWLMRDNGRIAINKAWIEQRYRQTPQMAMDQGAIAGQQGDLQ